MMAKGAGEVLKSSFVLSGWKFPRPIVTDGDDRFLFDLEVKIKLGHIDREQILVDVLVDFPSEVLMLRVGLLANIMDTIVSHDSSDSISFLTFALDWLRLFVVKSVRSFEILLCGEKSSSSPSKSDVCDDSVSSLSSRMARATRCLKYPQHCPLDPQVPTICQTIANTGTPVPSVAGFAFAVCAAALPVLKTKDPAHATSVLVLIRSALPFIFEPTVALTNFRHKLSPENSSIGVDESIHLSFGRLQHLLNRIEHLLVIFDGIALMKAADSCLLTSENSAYFSFEIVYSAVILEIVTACPLEWLERENCNDRDIFLKFGSKTIDFLADFLIVGGIIEPNQSVHGNQSMCLKEEIIFDAFLPKVGCLLRVFAPSLEADIRQLMMTKVCINELCGVESVINQAKREQHIMESHTVDNAISILETDKIDGIISIPDDVEACIVRHAISVVVCAFNTTESPVVDENRCRGIHNIIRLLLFGKTSTKTLAIASILSTMSLPQDIFETSRSIVVESERKVHEHGGCDKENFVAGLLHLCSPSQFASHSNAALVAELAVAGFMHLLLVFCVDMNDCSRESLNLRFLSISLLEMLSYYCIQNYALDTFVARDWCPLLVDLKLLEWGSEQNQDSIACTFGHSFPEGVRKLTEKIEGLCAVSLERQCRSSYEHAAVIGLFHRSPKVRCRSAFRLRREFPYGNEASAMIENNFVEFDPLFGTNFVALDDSSMTTIHRDESDCREVGGRGDFDARSKWSEAETIPMFTHGDLQKLLSIGFGGCDAEIRASALEQTLCLLEDADVAATMDDEWVLQVVSSSIRSLELLWPTSVVDGFEEQTRDERRLQLEALKLIRKLFVAFPNVKEEAISCLNCLSKSRSGGVGEINGKDTVKKSICLQPVVRMVVSSKEVFDDFAARAIAAEILLIAVVDHSRFSLAVLGRQRDVASRLRLDVSFREAMPVKSCNPDLLVPRRIAFHVLFPSSSNVSRGERKLLSFKLEALHSDGMNWNFVCTRCKVLEVCEKQRKLPATLLNKILNASTSHTSSKNLSNWAALAVGQLQQADNHVRFREGICVCLGLSAAISSSTFAGQLIESGIAGTVIPRILNKLPNNEKDLMTLTQVLTLLKNIVESVSGANECNKLSIATSQMQIMCRDIYQALTGPMLPLLCSHATQELFQSQSQLRILQNVQHLLIRLLIASMSTNVLQLISSSPAKEAVSVISRLAFNEVGGGSMVRAAACSLLEMMIRNFGAWEIFKASTDEFTSYSLLSCYPMTSPFETLLNNAKLIRPPDSFRGTSIVVGMLRVLFVCSTCQYNDSRSRVTKGISIGDSKWILRLCFDRRADVKILALEIVRIMIRMSIWEPSPVCVHNNAIVDQSLTFTEHIQYILLDSSESLAVRHTAGCILVDLFESEGPYLSHDGGGNLDILLRGLSDNLRCCNENTAVSLKNTVLLLRRLVKLFARGNKSFESLLVAFKSLKMLPSLVLILQPDLLKTMTGSIRYGDCCVDGTEVFAVDLKSDIDLSKGWQRLHTTWMAKEAAAVHAAQADTSSIFLAIGHFQQRILNECLRHTNLLPHLIGLLTSDKTNDLRDLSKEMFCPNHSSHFQLFAFLVANEAKVKEKLPIDCVSVSDLTCTNEVIPGKILESLNWWFRNIASNLKLLQKSTDKYFLSFLFRMLQASLRLMGSMLTYEKWQRSLGLGGFAKDCDIGMTMERGLVSLLELQHILAATIHQKNPSWSFYDDIPGLSLRTRVVLSAVLHCSHKAREIAFSGRSGGRTGHSGHELMMDCIELLKSSMSGLLDPLGHRKMIICDKSKLKILRRRRQQQESRQHSSSNGDATTTSIHSLLSPRSTEKWASKVRKVKIRPKSENACSLNEQCQLPSPEQQMTVGYHRSLIDIAHSSRTKMWCALLFLQSILPSCLQAQQLASELGLHESLSTMLSFFRVWVTKAAVNLSKFTMRSHSIKVLWAPSHGELTAALFSVCASFVHGCDLTKSVFLRSESAVLLSSDAMSFGRRTIINQFAAMSLSRGFLSVIRLLSLDLLDSIISSVPTNVDVQKKMMLGNLMLESLQLSHQKLTADPDVLAGLIQTWAACLVTENRSTPFSPPSCKVVHVKSQMDVTIPELVESVWKASQGRNDALAALCGCIGRIAAKIASQDSQPFCADDAADHSQIKSPRKLNAIGQRRLMGNLTSQRVLKFLSKMACGYECGHPLVVTRSRLALWVVLHVSEQARTMIKQDGFIAHECLGKNCEFTDIVNEETMSPASTKVVGALNALLA